MFSIHSFILYYRGGVKYFLVREFCRKLFFVFGVYLFLVGAFSLHLHFQDKAELQAEIARLKEDYSLKNREYLLLNNQFSAVSQIYNEKQYIARVITAINPPLRPENVHIWIKSIRDNANIITSNLNTYSQTKLNSQDSEYSLNPGIALLLSVAALESDFKFNTRSHKGAYGPMQLRKVAAEQIGLTDRSDPANNINGGARYLSVMLRKYFAYPDQLELALASYNAGTRRVFNEWMPNWGNKWPNINDGLKTNGGMFKETRNYVTSIMALTQLFVSGDWNLRSRFFWSDYKRYARNFDLASFYAETSNLQDNPLRIRFNPIF